MSDPTRTGDGSEPVAHPEQPVHLPIQPDPDPTEYRDGPGLVEASVVEPAPATVVPDEGPTGSATGEIPAMADGRPAEPEHAGAQVVYVQAPLPPRVRGNRGVGIVLALVGALVFALLFAGVVAGLMALFLDPADVNEQIGDFVSSASFWVPILFFALGFVLIVLLLNRAAWWLHVLGSLLVALVVYFGSIGLLLLLGNVVALSPEDAESRFTVLAVNPVVIAAAFVAREVSIWIGFLIAYRGRRVTARNLEARQMFDREQAEKRAEYGRTGAPA
jgi:hypothetical protein